MGAPRRADPGQGRPGVRAAKRRVPEVLVADGDEHRRAEVLPRSHDLPRPRAVREADGRPRRRHDRRLGSRRRLLRDRRGGRHVRGGAEGDPRQPVRVVQLARSGSTSASRRSRSARPASSSRSRTRWSRSSTGSAARASSSAAAPARVSTSRGCARRRSSCRRAGTRPARCRSCAARTRRPGRSSRAARRGARRRWSCSTSTTRTSTSSSGARREEERKARVLEAAGYDMTLDSSRLGVDPVPEREQLGARHRRVHGGGRRGQGLEPHRPHRRLGDRDASRRGSCCATSRLRRGSAPTRASSTTRRSTRGTRCRTRARINASNPCSEYMSIDDTACNLASLNLMKFRKEDGELDVEAFEHAVDVVFLAQEIAVGYSSYPTPEIGRNAVGLPAARARLREPRRAADGARPAVRLGRGSRVRGGDHGADDGSRLPQVGRGREADGLVRRLPAERGGDDRRDREASRRGRQHQPLRLGARRSPARRRGGPGTTRSRSARWPASATRRRRCSRRPGRSAS